MFNLDTGVNILYVPYRGTGPMLAALLAGEVQMFTDPSTTILPHIQGGKAPSARGHHRRARPEIAGHPDHGGGGLSEDASPFWLGVVAPAGTPPEIIDKLNAAFRESLRAAGDAARLATSAPRSRSARRKPSAR